MLNEGLDSLHHPTEKNCSVFYEKKEVHMCVYGQNMHWLHVNIVWAALRLGWIIMAN